MKYIIIPTLTFLWAIIFTLGCFCVDVITTPLFSLWEGKFTKGMCWEPTYIMRFNTFLSPYFTKNPNGSTDFYSFDSYYYFIWGQGSYR